VALLSAQLETRIQLAAALVSIATASAAFGVPLIIGGEAWARERTDIKFVRVEQPDVFVRAA
jgi:hypothetical protein